MPGTTTTWPDATFGYAWNAAGQIASEAIEAFRTELPMTTAHTRRSVAMMALGGFLATAYLLAGVIGGEVVDFGDFTNEGCD